MDVIFATNNKFCRQAAIAIFSLLDNNKEEKITIHLFTIDCNEDSISIIKSSITNFKVNLKIYYISEQEFIGFPPTRQFSIACYLRILSPTLLPNISKALYLDCDVIINGSIKELWEIDITHNSIAAVKDASLSYNIVKDYIGFNYFEGYVNSGVLLINLDYWRTNNIQKQLTDYLKGHQVRFPDQDAINIILHNSIKIIHPKWNCHTGYFAFPPLVSSDQKKHIKELWNKAIIIHFTGAIKPWHKECVNPYKHVYIKYQKRITDSKPTCENSTIKNDVMIILRHIKIIIAKIISYTYL